MNIPQTTPSSHNGFSGTAVLLVLLEQNLFYSAAYPYLDACHMKGTLPTCIFRIDIHPLIFEKLSQLLALRHGHSRHSGHWKREENTNVNARETC